MSEGARGIGDAARDLVRSLADKAGLDELKATLATLERGAVTSADAEVWAATSLTHEETATVERRLRAKYGDDLRIRHHVDPALIGGMVVRVGDRYVDGSLATRLGRLRQELTAGRMT